MPTTIKQITPVEYELEIEAAAEDLAPEFEKALRQQRSRTQIKGFRAGKVPLSLVKKMYGKALAYSVADAHVQRTYEEEVLEGSEHDVLGRPTLTRFDYEMDGDLRATITFGVRPEIELQDVEDIAVTRLIHEVTDEEVETEIERILREQADLVPVEDEPITGEELIVFDLQELDPATRTPLIGKRDEDQSMFLDDPRVRENEMLEALAEAVVGAKAGDEVVFNFEHDADHGLHTGDHAHIFRVSIKEVKRRDVDELDDAVVKELTNGLFEDVESFRADIRQRIEQAWQERSRELFEVSLIEQMLALHVVPVPGSVIDMYLDAYLEDAKKQSGEEGLPEGFSEEAFRAANRDRAEQQARWMLLRDRLIEEERLDVSNEDLDAFFEREAERDGRLAAEEIKKFYQSVPQLIDRVEERLLNEKVFERLAERFTVVEKDRETIEREIEERRSQAEAHLEGQEAVQAAALAAAEAQAGLSETPDDEE